jgi:hypothetical protein
LTLSDGVGVLLIEISVDDTAEDLASCAAPESADPAASTLERGFSRYHIDIGAIAPALDENGRVPRGRDGGRALAVYDVAYDPAGLVAAAGLPYRLYLECRTMAGGGWVLGIAHLVPAAEYEATIAVRQAVLATIDG